MRISRLALSVAFAAGSLTLHSASALSEDSSPSKGQPVKLKDVVVTATKEGEVNVQKVPASISAYTEDQLVDAGIKNIEDLKFQTPGMNVTRNGQATRLYMRGIGTNLDLIGSDPSVTVHLDGIYLSRTTSILDDLLDVERVEILRGPQGTLYGRNSTGGTINIISKLPQTEPEGKASVELGNYNHRTFAASASGPLVGESLLGGIALSKTDHDPYVDDIGTSQTDGLMDDDSLGARGTLRYILDNQGEIILRSDYNNVDRSTGAYKPTGLTTTGATSPLAGALVLPSDPFEMNISYDDPTVDITHWGTSAEIQWPLSSSLKVVSLTGYRNLDFKTVEDTDGSNLNVLLSEVNDDQHQVSEELRLHYVQNGLSLVNGLYYLNEDHKTDTTVNVLAPGLRNHFDVSNETTAYALFSQGTYAVTSQLNATLGVRYSKEKKDFTNTNRLTNATGAQVSGFNTQKSQDWDAWSPKAGIDYSVTPQAMVYGNVSRGFKSGGFNFTSTDPQFDPEYVWAYEVGTKLDFKEQQLRSNIALFYYDYTDLQVSDFTRAGVLSITNAADATVKGLEIENQWSPSVDWLFEANYAYLDATYDKYLAPSGTTSVDVSGNRLNASPENKFSLAAQYFQDVDFGTFSYRLEYAWQDKQFFTAFNQDVSSQDSYGLINARVSFRTTDEKWEVLAYGENLTNENYSTSSREFTAATVGVSKDIAPPLTAGVKLVYHFM